MELERIWSRDRAEPEIGAPHPRDGLPVSEAEHELHPHAHVPAVALHDAEDVDVLIVAGERHEIDQRGGAAVSLE